MPRGPKAAHGAGPKWAQWGKRVPKGRWKEPKRSQKCTKTVIQNPRVRTSCVETLHAETSIPCHWGWLAHLRKHPVHSASRSATLLRRAAYMVHPTCVETLPKHRYFVIEDGSPMHLINIEDGSPTWLTLHAPCNGMMFWCCLLINYKTMGAATEAVSWLAKHKQYF